MEKLGITSSKKTCTILAEEQVVPGHTSQQGGSFLGVASRKEQVVPGHTSQQGGSFLGVASRKIASSQVPKAGAARSGSDSNAVRRIGPKAATDATGKALDVGGAACHDVQRRRSAVELIADLLQQLRPEARSQVIARHLQQWQRLELERFMLRKQTAQPSLLGPVASLHAVDENLNKSVQVASSKVSTGVERHSAHRNRKPAGVFTRRCNGSVKYRASVSVSGLRMQAMPRKDFQAASKDYERLEKIRQHIQAGDGDFEARVRRALASERADVSSCDRTGLVFNVASCGLYRKVLFSPVFHEDDVEKALTAWRKLNHARIFGLDHNAKRRRRTPAQMQESWERMKLVQSELWCEAGANSCKVQQRLDKHESRAASRLEREWERWNREAMSCEERRTRFCQRRDRHCLLVKMRRVRELNRIAKREAKALNRLDSLIARWTPIRNCKAACLSVARRVGRRCCSSRNGNPGCKTSGIDWKK